MFFNYLESTCFIKIFRYGRFDSVEYVSLGAEWQHARFIVCFNFSCCLLNKKLSIFSRHDTSSKCLTTINSKTHLRLSKDWNLSDGKFFLYLRGYSKYRSFISWNEGIWLTRSVNNWGNNYYLFLEREKKPNVIFI